MKASTGQRGQPVLELSGIVPDAALSEEAKGATEMSSAPSAHAGDTAVRESSRLRPRARLMTTLGHELISSDAVALTELVKNAFDADAQHVLVQVVGEVDLDGTLNAETGSILVLDDGHGMDRDTITTTWLEPATAHRRHNRRSPKGRRVLGEKGVGRFAAAKLGTLMELMSQRKGCEEVRLKVDWSVFEDEEKYLDQVEIQVETGATGMFDRNGLVREIWRSAAIPHLPGNPDILSEYGTLLKISGLRSRWNKDLVKEIRQLLSRLVNPFGESEVVSDFRIVLDLPVAFGIGSGLVESPTEIHRPHYRLEATVDGWGNATGEIDLKDGAHLCFGPEQLRPEDEPLQCGPFKIRLNVWDRDPASLKQLVGDSGGVKLARETLDAAAGISIYRNGFRILPFGERGDDWLGLDLRRVQSPTKRLSNNQIAGYILIDRDANPDLMDQTNREGLIEGPAFDDLRKATRLLLNKLENERYDIRPRRESRRPGGGLLDRVDLSELRRAVSEAVPKDSAIPGLVDDLQQDLDDRMERIGEVLARYHRLATLGQLVDQVVHELGQPIPAIGDAAFLGTEAIDQALPISEESTLLAKLLGYFATISRQAKAANDVIRRIVPFGGRRRGRPKTYVIEEAIENAVGLLHERIESVGAEVLLPVSAHRVSIDGTEIQEVLVNLIDNSLHWLRWAKKKRVIAIDVSHEHDGSLDLIVEDSGPGVPEADRHRIFEPYFTTKEDGVGLGLAIAGEIVSDYYDGDLELLSPGELGGARFRATLRKRV